MSALAVIPWMAILTTVTNGDLENGIYEVVGKKNATTIVDDTGRKLHLGSAIAFQVGEGSVWSETNSNSRFGFCLRNCQTDKKTAAQLFAIVVDGRCFSLSGSQNTIDGKILHDLWGRVSSEKNAGVIAKYLKTKVKLSKHPRHQLQTKLRPTKEFFVVGESMPVEIEIKNVGDSPIYFMNGGQQRGSRNNQFRFIGFSDKNRGRAVADTGDPMNFGGMAAFVTLKPGETFKRSADLSKWFRITEPETLQLTGMFELELTNKEFDATSPRWRDFAVGECTVRVKRK